MGRRPDHKAFVVCVANVGYEASLIVRRLYATIPDPEAETHGLLRVIDESGEDFLFPRDLFASVAIPRDLSQKLAP